MTNSKVGTMLVERNTYHRPKLGAILHSDPTSLYTAIHDDDEDLSNNRLSNASASPINYGVDSSSSNLMSPWNQASSPYNRSPWLLPSPAINLYHHHHDNNNYYPENGLIGSLVREEGHIYSLAVSGDLLYTGSDSKNIRVWKDLKDYTGFKSSSGLVKTIVISCEKIFTGHQDGKIRVWKVSHKNPTNHKRVGSLPKLKDYVKSSMNPKNYVEVRRHRNAVKVKHYDAVSSLSLDEEEGLLYSGSWDKTLKVWRVSDSKCLESITAHDDAVNSVVAAFGGYVFTGSADGTVKMWRREPKGKKTKHELDRVLLKQENAVTSLAVNTLSTVIYCGSSDGLVNYWERGEKNSLSHASVLKGHKLAVLCLAAAGNLVFSGSADKNVCVWKREDSGVHTCLSVLTGHMGPVKCIAVHEEQEPEAYREKGDQRWIVYTGSLDKSVKVWRVTEHAPEWRMIQASRDCAPYDSSTARFSHCWPRTNPNSVSNGNSNNNNTPELRMIQGPPVSKCGAAANDSSATGLSHSSSPTNAISVTDGSSNTTTNININNGGLKTPFPVSCNKSWQNLSGEHNRKEKMETGDFDASSNNHLQNNGDYQNRRRLQ